MCMIVKIYLSAAILIAVAVALAFATPFLIIGKLVDLITPSDK